MFIYSRQAKLATKWQRQALKNVYKPTRPATINRFVSNTLIVNYFANQLIGLSTFSKQKSKNSPIPAS